jgi:hypothetical protein
MMGKRLKSLLGNRAINYLIIHGFLHRLAWGGSSVFIGVYLYSEAVSLPDIFLISSGILALRFVFRFLLIPTVAALGLRRALILGTFLTRLLRWFTASDRRSYCFASFQPWAQLFISPAIMSISARWEMRSAEARRSVSASF